MNCNEPYSEETVAIAIAAWKARPANGVAGRFMTQDLHRKIQNAFNLDIGCCVFGPYLLSLSLFFALLVWYKAHI
jgi:hypothetical protein